MRLRALLFCLLAACSSEADAPEEPETAAGAEAGLEQPSLDAQATDASRGLEAGARDAASEPCDPGSGPALEFGYICADAAAPAQDAAREAAVDACAADQCSPDAAATKPEVDGGAAEEGPCAMSEHDCSVSAFFAAQPGSGTCSFDLFGMLEVRYRDCETCGKAGYLYSQDVVIMDCGGCSQVYAHGWPGLGARQAAASCRSSRLTANLAGSNAGNCVDVYTRLSSSHNGSLNTGMHSQRMCRCNVSQKQCISCSAGACDEVP